MAHDYSLDSGGNYNLKEIGLVKYKPAIVAFDGDIYKAMDGQHRINLAKKEHRSHSVFVVLVSKELMQRIL